MVTDEDYNSIVDETLSNRESMLNLGLAKVDDLISAVELNPCKHNEELVSFLWGVSTRDLLDEETHLKTEVGTKLREITLYGKPLTGEQLFDFLMLIVSTRDNLDTLGLIGFKEVNLESGMRRVISLLEKGQVTDYKVKLAGQILGAHEFYMWLNCHLYEYSKVSELPKNLDWFYIE